MPYLDTPEGSTDDKVAWGSDVAAQMLRRAGLKYVALNPGASYRGLHDSIVNHLGNRDPGMLLCLHEDHAVGIAHGYAKASGMPMGAIVHSNVGLMHGHMGIFNAHCDRVPIMIMGATGPIDSHQRRPWIDWIHTSADQASIVRDIIKFDNQPASPEGIIDAMARAYVTCRTEPCGPVYIVLDAGLQEASLEKTPDLPDMARYQPPAPPRAAKADIDTIAGWLKGAKKPLLLFGRMNKSQEGWDARVKLAEAIGACVMTDLKVGSCFPTDHEAHVIAPFNQAGKAEHEIIGEADVIIGFDWVDMGGVICPPKGGGNRNAKIARISLDHHVHTGSHSVYQQMAPTDLFVSANADSVVADLNDALGASGKKQPWKQAVRKGRKPASPGRITMDDVGVALREAFDKPDEVCFASVSRGWNCDLWPWRNPHAYNGKDGGGGIGSGPPISVGVALANDDAGRKTVAVLGDGDFMMGGHAVWTAVKHKIPLLIIINNNQSYFNDELHQETVAKRRNRPVGNRWIGQSMTGPEIDICKFVEAQGATGIGPVSNPDDLKAAIEQGVKVLNEGGVALVNVLVPPVDRDSGSTGVRNT
ncbi:MAG: thiamine pyrophosphate-binding protein [Beijerinckiaceae bacterium]